MSNRLGLVQKGHSLKIRWIFINLEWIRGGGDLERVYWGISMGGIPSRRGGLVLDWTVTGQEGWLQHLQNSILVSKVAEASWQAWLWCYYLQHDFWYGKLGTHFSLHGRFPECVDQCVVKIWVCLSSHKFFDSFPQNASCGLFKTPFLCLVMPLLLWKLGSSLEFANKFSLPQTRLTGTAQAKRMKSFTIQISQILL